MSVDKSPDRIRRMFGDIAQRYDFLNHVLSFGVDTYWRWRTVRKVPPRGSAPILDLCTGTGDLALAYYRAGRGQTPIVGADFCFPMLAIGARKSANRGATGSVQFIEADAQRLPFEAETFQIVTVAFGLRNVSDLDRGLSEMTRVCRRGGSVAVLEFSEPRWRPWRAVYGWYFRNILPRIGRALARDPSGAYNYLPQSVGEFPHGAALAARMEGAGLSNVRWFPLTLGVATLYVGVK